MGLEFMGGSGKLILRLDNGEFPEAGRIWMYRPEGGFQDAENRSGSLFQGGFRIGGFQIPGKKN
jgi:hypothetical protein